MLNENDEENRSQVGVIGTDIVDNLFPTVDPLGKEIRVEGEVYRIIGVGKKQGTTLGQSRDNYVAIPITTYLKQFGSHTSIRISGKANGVGTELDAAIDEARAVLRARRHGISETRSDVAQGAGETRALHPAQLVAQRSLQRPRCEHVLNNVMRKNHFVPGCPHQISQDEII